MRPDCNLRIQRRADNIARHAHGHVLIINLEVDFLELKILTPIFIVGNAKWAKVRSYDFTIVVRDNKKKRSSLYCIVLQQRSSL